MIKESHFHDNKNGVIMTEWVLILGSSTGHGGATAERLAKDGYGVIGFHLDRGEVKKEAELLKEKISKFLQM